MHTLLLWLRDAPVAHLSPLTPPAAPTHCSSCQHPQPYRWGTRTRTVPDLQGTLTVIVQRYRCRACQRPWSVAPERVDRTRRTQRLQQWHRGLWAWGGSVRRIGWLERFAWGWDCPRRAVWRDVRRQAQRLGRHTASHETTDWVGLDGFRLRDWGGVVAALSATLGQWVGWWGQETTPADWEGGLAETMRAWGATGLVGVYREVARRHGWERAVDWYHWRRWVGRVLDELAETLPCSGRALVARIRRWVQEVCADGAEPLWAFWAQVPVRRVRGQRASPWLRLREVIGRLASGWAA